MFFCFFFVCLLLLIFKETVLKSLWTADTQVGLLQIHQRKNIASVLLVIRVDDHFTSTSLGQKKTRKDHMICL